MSVPDRRKFRNRWHHQIEPSDVQPGDMVQVYDRGQRWRRVKSVTRKGIRTEGYKYNGIQVYGAKTYERAQVVTAWSKRKS